MTHGSHQAATTISPGLTRDQAEKLLSYIRDCTGQYEKDGTFGKNVIDGFRVLDRHLSGGGPLPEQWRAASVS